jgi:hypothetical protein
MTRSADYRSSIGEGRVRDGYGGGAFGDGDGALQPMSGGGA